MIPAADRYSAENEDKHREAVRRELARCQRTDEDFEINERLILTAPDGGRWAVVVSNTGALSTVAA